MLKNFGYDGTYHDENISASVLLENPLEHGIEATALVFSVMVSSKFGGTVTSIQEDFTFYIMDESDCLYNTEWTRYLKNNLEDDEPVCRPDGLIYTDFQHNFLFQNLRVAFYYRPYKKIIIIELKH